MPRSRKGSSRGGADFEHVHAEAWASAYSSFTARAELVGGIYIWEIGFTLQPLFSLNWIHFLLNG
ncbi:hypothetical protein Hanom_Chr07g00612201 [Helianthus anomalus]